MLYSKAISPNVFSFFIDKKFTFLGEFKGGKNKELFILDDDPAVLDFLAFDLKNKEFNMDLILSMDIAKDYLWFKVYDFLVLDVIMAGNVTSIQIIEYLKNEIDHPNEETPIIVISSGMTDGFSKSIMEKMPQIKGTLPKPLKRNELYEMIKDFSEFEEDDEFDELDDELSESFFDDEIFEELEETVVKHIKDVDEGTIIIKGTKSWEEDAQWVRSNGDQEEDENEVRFSSESEDLGEEATRVKGNGEANEDDENWIGQGSTEDISEDATRVDGQGIGKEEDENWIGQGSTEDLSEDSTRVPGKGIGKEEDENWIGQGSTEDISEDATRVDGQGIGKEEDENWNGQGFTEDLSEDSTRVPGKGIGKEEDENWVGKGFTEELSEEARRVEGKGIGKEEDKKWKGKGSTEEIEEGSMKTKSSDSIKVLDLDIEIQDFKKNRYPKKEDMELLKKILSSKTKINLTGIKNEPGKMIFNERNIIRETHDGTNMMFKEESFVKETVVRNNSQLIKKSKELSKKQNLQLTQNDKILLIKSNKNLFHKNLKGQTALMVFALKGQKSIVDQILTTRSPINAQDGDGNTCLQYAIKARRIDIIEALIDGGASLKIKDNNGLEPLFDGIETNDVEVVRSLIKKGARINPVMKGFSFLMQAYINKNVAIFEELYKSGVKTEIRDLQGKTILDWAIEDDNKTIISIIDPFHKKAS